jgi:hypothetical protein
MKLENHADSVALFVTFYNFCRIHKELGRLLRTGAANFSASGLKRQDNDLVVIESVEAAAPFKRAFDARFAGGEGLSIKARQ